MCLDTFLWQAAGLSTMSETNRILHARSFSQKLIRDSETEMARDRVKQRRENSTERKQRIYSDIYQPYCESWRTALQKVCSTVYTRPSRVRKRPKRWPANCLTYQSSESYGTVIQQDTGGWKAYKPSGPVHRERSPKNSWPMCRTGNVKLTA